MTRLSRLSAAGSRRAIRAARCRRAIRPWRLSRDRRPALRSYGPPGTRCPDGSVLTGREGTIPVLLSGDSWRSWVRTLLSRRVYADPNARSRSRMPAAVAIATANPIGAKIYGEASGRSGLEGRAKATADEMGQLTEAFPWSEASATPPGAYPSPRMFKPGSGNSRLHQVRRGLIGPAMPREFVRAGRH